ncbi:MAG: MBL fold metallo-hydrolase [Promethearchaeia archaeon]
MVKIVFLGGCREVGRSAILIESDSGDQIVLDYGIRFSDEERFPQNSIFKKLKGVALTHCHIDHSGGLPYLYKNNSIPFYTNEITLRLVEILLNDMFRISQYPYPFGKKELKKLVDSGKFLSYGKKYKISKNIYLTFIDAGHIPGSASILVEVDGKNILYTGDINNQFTRLIRSAKTESIPEIDALIIESTYSMKDHPNRKELEIEFVKRIMNIIDNGGNVLIPAFGVARSQEALLILYRNNFKGHIFIDGIARKISRIFMNYPDFLKDIEVYLKAIKKAYFISERKSQQDRIFAKRTKGVFIAPSGMLKGGTALEYAKSFAQDPNSAIYLVGYQIEGSPGRTLLEDGILEYKTFSRRTAIEKIEKIDVNCEVEYFDFSSHSDSTHLHEYVNNLSFKDDSNIVFCVHGDNKSTTTFAKELNNNSYNAISPEAGESYKI